MASANTRQFAAELKELTITNWNGKTLSVLPQLVELNLHFSMHAKAAYASVMLSDSIDLIQSLPIVGGEKVVLMIETPTLDPIEATMYIDDIVTSAVHSEGYSKTYVLRCVAKAAHLNKKGSAQKFVKGTGPELVQLIAKEQLEIANVEVEAASTTLQLNLPDLPPFAGIDYIANITTSSENPGSIYMFYQDRDAVHFRTVAGMFANGKEYTYKYYPVNFAGYEENDQWRILNLRQHATGSLSKKVEGVLENELVEFDLKKRVFKVTKFDYKKDYQKAQAIASSKTLPDQEIDKWKAANNSTHFGDSTAVRYRSLETAFGVADYGMAEKHGASLAQRKLLDKPVVTFTAPGYTALKIGDKIKIDVIQQVGTTKPTQDMFYSEPFLVGSVRHIINPNMRHFMVVDLYRDGAHKDVEDTEYDIGEKKKPA